MILGGGIDVMVEMLLRDHHHEFHRGVIVVQHDE